MKFTGKWTQLFVDYFRKKQIITLEVDEDVRETFELLKGKDKLMVEIKEYKAKRSLDANAYYWVLITKLAKKLDTSNNELHNDMLAEYGFPELIDGKLARIPLPNTDEAEQTIHKAMEYHLKPTSQVVAGKDGVDYRTYIMIRGSSTYNTDEMARLINGLISECKSAGIPDAEIASPEEQRILKERYGVNIG